MDAQTLLAGVPSSMKADPWLAGVVSALALGSALWSIRTGEARLFHNRFRRQEDPTGFWVAVAIVGAIGTVLLAFFLLGPRR